MHIPHSDVHAIYILVAKYVWKPSRVAKFQEAGLDLRQLGQQPVQTKTMLMEGRVAAAIQVRVARVQQEIVVESPGGRTEVESVRAWRDPMSMGLFCAEGLG